MADSAKGERDPFKTAPRRHSTLKREGAVTSECGDGGRGGRGVDSRSRGVIRGMIFHAAPFQRLLFHEQGESPRVHETSNVGAPS